jgi:hypothetical protein
LNPEDLLNEDPGDPMVNAVQTLSEKIKQRRAQMLVHSYLYYTLDDTIISDEKWQQWADELTELQKQKSEIGFYDEEFGDWNGSTGMHLPSPVWIVNKAKKLLTSKDK